MEKPRKVNPEAPTLLDLSEKKISTSSALSLDPKAKIRNQRSSTREKIILFLTALSLGAAAGSYGTYRLMESQRRPRAFASGQSSLSRPDAVKPVYPSSLPELPLQESAQDSDPGYPDTSEKLRKAIKDTNVKVGIDDFVKSNKFVNTLVLANKGDAAKEFHWVPLNQENLKDDDLLIAIKLEKPEYKYLLKFVARQPLSTVEDEDEPLIIYAFYRCVKSDNRENRGGSIAIVDPGSLINMKNSSRKRPVQYLTTTGFILPKCESNKASTEQ